MIEFQIDGVPFNSESIWLKGGSRFSKQTFSFQTQQAANDLEALARLDDDGTLRGSRISNQGNVWNLTLLWRTDDGELRDRLRNQLQRQLSQEDFKRYDREGAIDKIVNEVASVSQNQEAAKLKASENKTS